MKRLEEYVNETQVNEGFWKSLLGALGISLHDELGKRYPNFVKAFDELQKSDAEDKELIKMFNAQYDAIDKMELSDDEKVYQKIQLAMSQNARFEGEQKDKNVTQLDKENHKGYYEDIQAKLKAIEKNHSEIYNKYMEAAKKGPVKKEDVIGKGESANEEDPIKMLATKHKATLQDLAKLGGLDEKTLQGIEAKVKAFINTSETFAEKLNNIIIEGGEDIKNELKSDDKAQSLYSIILVAYYGLKNLKLINDIDDLAKLLKLIESQEVKEGKISLKDYIEKL